MRIVMAVSVVIFMTSMVYAVDSSDVHTSNLEYCKLPYVDKVEGSTGTYRGQCQNNKPYGEGTVSFDNGDTLTGTFKGGLFEGDGVYTTADGSVYTGDWQGGQRHGQGTYTWARGSRYVGEWSDDRRHGKGVFTWPNGNRFEGEFRDNKRYNGKYYTSSGHVYRCRLGLCK